MFEVNSKKQSVLRELIMTKLDLGEGRGCFFFASHKNEGISKDASYDIVVSVASEPVVLGLSH